MKKLIIGILMLLMVGVADQTALTTDYPSIKQKVVGETYQMRRKIDRIIDKVDAEVANTEKDTMTITTIAGDDLTLTDDLIVGDASTLTGIVTVATGLTQTAVSRTASITRNATSSPNGVIAAGTSVVVPTGNNDGVDDDNQDLVIVLPTPVPGHIITILPFNTAYEIIPASRAHYINGTLCDVEKELQVPTDSMMTAVAVSATKWIITQQDNDGTTDAGGTPD